MNSIQNSLSKNTNSAVAEVASMIRSHSKDHKILIVVEGPSDCKVFRKMYDANDFDVYNSIHYTGCLHFKDILDGCNKKYKSRFLIIKDADFDNLNQIHYDKYPNLFLTDTHDLETLMLNYSFVPNNFNPICPFNNKNFVLSVMGDIIHLSVIKWYNEIYKLNLNFKNTCKVGRCYKGNCSITISDWLNAIAQEPQNSMKKIPTENDILTFEHSPKNCVQNYMQITNGHDLIDGMTIKHHYNINENLKKDSVYQEIENNFDENFYMNTTLCFNINKWLIQIKSNTKCIP
jgi:hypothetical protein